MLSIQSMCSDLIDHQYEKFLKSSTVVGRVSIVKYRVVFCPLRERELKDSSY